MACKELQAEHIIMSSKHMIKSSNTVGINSGGNVYTLLDYVYYMSVQLCILAASQIEANINYEAILCIPPCIFCSPKNQCRYYMHNNVNE